LDTHALGQAELNTVPLLPLHVYTSCTCPINRSSRPCYTYSVNKCLCTLTRFKPTDGCLQNLVYTVPLLPLHVYTSCTCPINRSSRPCYTYSVNKCLCTLTRFKPTDGFLQNLVYTVPLLPLHVYTSCTCPINRSSRPCYTYSVYKCLCTLTLFKPTDECLRIRCLLHRTSL